jgi:hypothetical protein
VKRPLSNELNKLEEVVSGVDVASHTVKLRPITLTGNLLALTSHEKALLAVDVGDVALDLPTAIRCALEHQHGSSISERELNLVQAGAELVVESLAQIVRATEGSWDPKLGTPPRTPSITDP